MADSSKVAVGPGNGASSTGQEKTTAFLEFSFSVTLSLKNESEIKTFSG